MIKLKQLRNEKNISQATVAKTLGITQQAYANYERGVRQPDYETLIKIADLFNVSLDYLLGHDTNIFTTGDIKNNSGVIGNSGTVNISKNESSVFENDIIRIFRQVTDGKTKLKIMQFMYDIEQEQNTKDNKNS